MKRLFLNKKEVDIKDVVVTVTKQINDIAELRDSQNHHSNKFSLPFTARNKKVLKGLGIVGNQSRAPYERVVADLKDGGNDLITDGYAIISNFNNNKGMFDVTIYDGNIFLFEALGSGKLKDLNFVDLQHELTLTNYINSFSNTSGYIYAVSDNGKFDESKVEINYQLPCVFVSTIWDKIFKEAGFDYVGNLFNSYKFKTLVLTLKRGYNSEVDTISNPFNYTNSDNGSSQTAPATSGYGVYYPSVKNIRLIIPNNSVFSDGVLYIQEDGQYTFSLSFNITGFLVANIFSLRIVNNGVTVYEETVTIPNNVTNSSISYTKILNLSANDNVEIFATITRNTGGLIYPFNYNYSYSASTTTASVINVSINNFIGDLSQKEFVKDIMQRFGLLIQKKKNQHTYEFKKINDLIQDTSTALDWSYKFNEVTGINYKCRNYAQFNRFAYYYKDADSDKFADGFLKVENRNLKQEKTHVQSPYYACDFSDNRLNNKPVTFTPFWEAVRDDTGTITKYRPINSKNYIVELKMNSESLKYGLTSGVLNTFTGLVPRLDFSNLRYNNIISENYGRLELILKWNKIFNATFNLNSNDVSNVDFLKLIYIKQLSSYFYLNKIKSFKSGKLTKVEIVKIQS